MSSSHFTEASLSALFDRAEAEYRRWLRREGIPDRDQRLSDLKTKELQTAGRAHETFAIYEDFLATGQRKRIDFYERVSRAECCPEMFAATRIGVFRRLIMTTAENGSKDLHGRISMYLNSVGDLSPTLRHALLDQRLYDQLQSRISEVVNAELGVLEAEGRLRLPEAPPEACYPGGAGAGGTGGGRKRGPATDYETAARVAGVVSRVSPDGHWRGNLEDICDGLDDERVPCPKPWKNKGYGTWSGCLPGERSLVVKAIEHRMKLAEQRKETFS